MSVITDSDQKPANRPSSNTVTKYVLMALLAVLTFGLTGLGAMVVMFALSTLRAGRDSAASHGISTINSSRLGGVAIVITFCLFVVGMVMLSITPLGWCEMSPSYICGPRSLFVPCWVVLRILRLIY